MHWHLDVTFKEDVNITLDKKEEYNLNILNKWCLLILKLFYGEENVTKKGMILYQYECQKVFGTDIDFVRFENNI